MVTAGRLSKTVEFFDGAEHLGEEMPNAAEHLVEAAKQAVAARG